MDFEPDGLVCWNRFWNWWAGVQKSKGGLFAVKMIMFWENFLRFCSCYY